MSVRSRLAGWMNMQIAKQVIVMRKDLNMRKGKMVAQGAHASLGAVLVIREALNERPGHEWGEAFRAWFSGSFTKICVSVNSERELMDIYCNAMDRFLPVKLITDNGTTEFNGVPTKTCLAIGPAWAEDIDKVTGGLPLL